MNKIQKAFEDAGIKPTSIRVITKKEMKVIRKRWKKVRKFIKKSKKASEEAAKCKIKFK